MEVRSLIFGFHTLDVKSFERVIDVEIPKILNSGYKYPHNKIKMFSKNTNKGDSD